MRSSGSSARAPTARPRSQTTRLAAQAANRSLGRDGAGGSRGRPRPRRTGRPRSSDRWEGRFDELSGDWRSGPLCVSPDTRCIGVLPAELEGILHRIFGGPVTLGIPLREDLRMFRNPLIDAIVVLLVVLLIFGPKRLPQLGKSLGHGMREFKDGITGSSKPDEEEERSELTQASTSAPAPETPAPESPAEAVPAPEVGSAERRS